MARSGRNARAREDAEKVVSNMHCARSVRTAGEIMEQSASYKKYRRLIKEHVTDMEKYRSQMDGYLRFLKIDISDIPEKTRDRAWDDFAQEEHEKSRKAWMNYIKEHPKAMRALCEYEHGMRN